MLGPGGALFTAARDSFDAIMTGQAGPCVLAIELARGAEVAFTAEWSRHGITTDRWEWAPRRGGQGPHFIDLVHLDARFVPILVH